MVPWGAPAAAGQGWGKFWPPGRGRRVSFQDHSVLRGYLGGQAPPELDGVRTAWWKNSITGLLAFFQLGPTGH